MHHTGDRLELSNNLEAKRDGLFGNPHEKLISHSIKLCNFAIISLNSRPSKLDQSTNFDTEQYHLNGQYLQHEHFPLPGQGWKLVSPQAPHC